MDLAASVQKVLEEIVLRITRSLAAENRYWNLCLAGGVALNCVANGRILRGRRFPKPLDTAGRGRRGRRSGRGPVRLPCLRRPTTRRFRFGGFHAGAYLGPTSPRPKSKRASRPPAPGFTSWTTRACFHLRGGADLRRRPGLVSRKNGNSAESAGRALHPRRTRDLPRPSLCSISKSNSGSLSAVRSVGAPRARGRTGLSWIGDSPYMLLVANVREDQSYPHDPRRRLCSELTS